MKKKYSIKQILTSNGNWWRFYNANKTKIRTSILICITKLLSCRNLVNCSKATENYKHTVNYLGRYVKRPPIAESKLRHYDGSDVTFSYRDHKAKAYRNFTSSVDDFITRFIQHIPDVGFRMIRYYGALANRVRGKFLPIIYALLGQQQRGLDSVQKISFASLIKATFNIDPFKCILCGGKMVLELVVYGKSSTSQLLSVHRELALLRKL